MAWPKPAPQKPLAGRQLAFRSSITNGRTLANYVDARSEWARRFRDIIEAHEADLGGGEFLSEGQRALVRRAALLQTELEFQESKFALIREEGKAPAEYRLELYQRMSNTLRRLVESLGLNEGRRMRDVTPPDITSHILDAVREREPIQ